MMRSLAILALASSLGGCMESPPGPGDNHVLWEGKSASGDFTATMFTRYCGGGDAQLIAVRPSALDFDPESGDQWVFRTEGKPAIKAAWEKSGDVLRVRRQAGPEVFLEVHVFRGLRIRYDDDPGKAGS